MERNAKDLLRTATAHDVCVRVLGDGIEQCFGFLPFQVPRHVFGIFHDKPDMPNPQPVAEPDVIG
jgi:hypothetical protein